MYPHSQMQKAKATLSRKFPTHQSLCEVALFEGFYPLQNESSDDRYARALDFLAKKYLKENNCKTIGGRLPGDISVKMEDK